MSSPSTASAAAGTFRIDQRKRRARAQMRRGLGTVAVEPIEPEPKREFRGHSRGEEGNTFETVFHRRPSRAWAQFGRKVQHFAAGGLGGGLAGQPPRGEAAGAAGEPAAEDPALRPLRREGLTGLF